VSVGPCGCYWGDGHFCGKCDPHLVLEWRASHGQRPIPVHASAGDYPDRRYGGHYALCRPEMWVAHDVQRATCKRCLRIMERDGLVQVERRRELETAGGPIYYAVYTTERKDGG
jgi:hypothetical protein